MNLNLIKKEIENFRTRPVTIAKNLTFNQEETINEIIYRYNSKFIDGEWDNQNDRKYFFNINRSACDTTTKAIDFDTKNINILTAAGGNPKRTWFFERDLKFWMKDQNFGRTLNGIFYRLPIFGSVVIKIVNGEIFFVDLRNFMCDKGVDNLKESDFIIEVHNTTPLEFKRLGEERGWKYQEVIDRFNPSNYDYIKIYERYGEVDGVYTKTLIAEPAENSQFVMSEDKVSKHPYFEFHLNKLPGRWMGIGIVELLTDPQIRINELTNQQVKSSYWTSLRLWQTQDQGINRNLLTDAVNGLVLNVQSPITPIDMADRTTTSIETEINRWSANSDKITFAHEPMRGQTMKGVTLGATELAAGLGGAFFGQIQENVALDVKQLLYDVVIPQFAKENTIKHTLRLVGDDLETYNRMLIDVKVNNEILKKLKKRVPSKEELEKMKVIISEKTKRGKEKLVDLPEDFYKNLKYKIDIDITGEQVDVRTRSANKFAALQAVTADPTLLTDPRKRKFFRSWLEDGGLRLEDFDTEEEPQLNEVVQKGSGGGVSRPTMPVNPVAGPTQQQV